MWNVQSVKDGTLDKLREISPHIIIATEVKKKKFPISMSYNWSYFERKEKENTGGGLAIGVTTHLCIMDRTEILPKEIRKLKEVALIHSK